jgi:hypothetical protein
MFIPSALSEQAKTNPPLITIFFDGGFDGG